jgi:6-phosphogluconolactonase (cycloisomerase 2 family)
VYVVNELDCTVTGYRFDAESGALQPFQWLPTLPWDKTLSRTPSFFTIAPDGRTMFVLNQDSDSIVAFSLDPENGRLLQPRPPVACGSPVCMVFLSS